MLSVIKTQSKALNFLEGALVIIVCMMLSDGFRPVIPSWNLLRQGLYVCIFIAVLFNTKAILATFFRSPSVVILVLYAFLSYFWSADRAATVSRSVALFFGTLFALYFAARFNTRDQIKLLAIFSLIALVFSVLFVFTIPSVGTAGSVWRGIFEQKNTFGRAMVICALVALTYPVETFWGRVGKLVWYLAAIFCIFMSDSMTSLIIVAVATLLFYVYRVLRWDALSAFIFTAAGAVPIALLLYGAITLDTDAFLISIGRNPTLTGRVSVWANVEYAISERPLMGYGYGGFWKKSEGVYGQLWSTNSNWQPGSAHNSYLDLWVQLGLFAVIIFVASSALMFIQALFHVRRTRSVEGLFPILYLTFLLILSFSEDFILFNSFAWVLYMAMGFTIAVAMAQDKVTESEEIEQDVIAFVPSQRRTMTVRRVGLG